MEINTTLGGLVFTLLLTALAVSPQAIATYLTLRAEANPSKATEIPEEEFRPFDFSHLRDRPTVTETRGARAHAANRPTVQPPAVPFNYPNA